MATRDTYEILLKLRDELSASLKQVNANLGKTTAAGKQTREEVKSLADKIRSATQPVREFSRAIGGLMAFGGVAMLVNSVAREIGEMESAYAKLYPESQKAAGSLTNWNAAMLEMKARQGAVIASVLNPVRAFFLDIIDPIGQATREVTNFNAEMKVLVDKYTSAATKQYKDEREALEVLTKARKDHSAALSEQGELLRALNVIRANKPTLTIVEGESPMQAQDRLLVKTILWQGELDKVQALYDKVHTSVGETGELIKEIPKWVEDHKKKLTEVANVAVKVAGYAETSAYWYGSAGEYIQIQNAALAIQIKEWETIGREIDESITGLAEYTGMMAKMPEPKAEAGWSGYRGWESQAFLELDKERNKLLREIRDGQLNQAMGFFQDPLAAITGAAQGGLSASGLASAGASGGAGGMIAEFFAEMMSGLGGLMESLAAFGPIVLLFLALIEVAQGLQEILAPLIDSMLKPIIELLKGIGNALGTLLLPIFQALEPAINAIISVLRIFMPIFQLLEPVFKIIGNVIKAMMIPVVAFCIAIVHIINAIIDSINWAFGWAGSSIPRLGIPAMPTFHEGGVAEDETVALLKKGEVVLNPYRSKAYIAGGGMGGGITINAPNARYLDANMAAELVRMGLVAMRA